jgi:hypothetical protein
MSRAQAPLNKLPAAQFAALNRTKKSRPKAACAGDL